MKVLIISASPRKGGNSDLLCDQFTLGAWDAGHDVEKIRLQEEKISYSLVCKECIETEKSIQQDEMNGFLEKMVAADVLVLATPVYFYTMSGQLKIFLDHTASRYQELKGKAYLIATCADTDISGMDGTISDFRQYLRCATGLKEAGMILATGVSGKADVVNFPIMFEAYRAGKSI